MSATKILWGQLFFVSIVVLTFVWTATEWTAWRLAYQPQLGAAWFTVGRWPIYQPLAFFIWWFQFDAYAPKIFVEGACIAASGGFAAIGIAIMLSVWRAKEAQQVTTYGSARWADAREVRRASLLGSDGVVLGRFDSHYLRHNGPEHVLYFAPTRSGKGVGLVIPTLLTWPSSTIVHDIKGENYQLTSGWRARFRPVLLFDPTNQASAAYIIGWDSGELSMRWLWRGTARSQRLTRKSGLPAVAIRSSKTAARRRAPKPKSRSRGRRVVPGQRA
jgi:type IV secretion system protein VirD4